MDALIDQLHSGAVANNITGGEISFHAYAPDPSIMVGPPSAAAINKLRNLRDNYGWALSPNPDFGN